MALKTVPSLLSLFAILLAITTETAIAGRNVPNHDSKKEEVKHPDWLFDHHDGSFLIPGIGRVMVPPAFGGGSSPHTPYTGNIGGGSGAGARHTYVPGADDTFVPNPGFEVPIPGSGRGAPNSARP